MFGLPESSQNKLKRITKRKREEIVDNTCIVYMLSFLPKASLCYVYISFDMCPGWLFCDSIQMFGPAFLLPPLARAPRLNWRIFVPRWSDCQVANLWPSQQRTTVEFLFQVSATFSVCSTPALQFFFVSFTLTPLFWQTSDLDTTGYPFRIKKWRLCGEKNNPYSICWLNFHANV